MKSHYSIGYFFSQAIKGLWRNGVMSMASIAVLMCCLVVMGVFGVLVANINVNLDTLELANEIVVFLDYEATDEDVERVEKALNGLKDSGISEIKYVSKEEALASMREEYAGTEYQELFDSISDGDNPLAASFEIKVDDVSKGSEIQFQLKTIDESVRKISNRMDIAQQFETIKKNVTYAFGVFLAVLMAVCLFIIINTISLAVYSRRNEIIVMRYVGATRWFIALPFVLEGIIIGILASLTAFVIEGQIYSAICRVIVGDMSLIKLIPYEDISMIMLGGFVGVGVLTGILGSMISLRKPIEE